jgi:hypothetical protein
MMVGGGKGPPVNGPSPNDIPGFSLSPQEEESCCAFYCVFAHKSIGLCATGPLRLRL